MKKVILLLVAFCFAANAFVVAQQALFTNHSLTFEGGDLKVVDAERHRMVNIKQDLLRLPEEVTLQMEFFSDADYSVDLKRQPQRHTIGDVDVYWGNSGDPAWAHLPNYHDVIMTVNRKTERAVIYAMTSDGVFMAIPSAKNKSLYRIYEEGAIDWSTKACGVEEPGSKSLTGEEKMMQSGCNEQDASGRYVVDMFFSYSHEAEAAIGDILAHAISQAETVNIGLTNSKVTNIYLRVIDLAVEDNFVGIYSPALNPNLVLYGPQMEAVGADMLADYQTPNPDVENAGGWAFAPGRTSINSATGPTVFRHEWGHNTGSSHCDPGLLPYSSGYDNGNVKTHMCGNNINFFSNPGLTDDMGLPLGDATSNNARAIRERAPVLSGYRRHLVPYDAADDGTPCPSTITDGVYYIQNVESGNYLTPDNVGNQGEKIFQSATNTENEEIWEVHSLGDGSVMIYNRNRNTGLDVFGGSNSEGHNVGVWGNNLNSNNQIWTITTAVSGNYIITSKQSGLSLRVPDGMTADGDQVWQAAYDDTDFAEWGFIPVTPDPGLVVVTGTSGATSCTNNTDATAGVAVTGAVGTPTYAWDDDAGSTTATLTNIGPGNYQATVTADGRNYFHRVSVSTSPALFAEVTTTRATPEAGGEITITNVLNATGALNYAWSDGGPNSAARTDMPAGDYAVTITDASGCEEVRKMRIIKTLTVGDYVLQHVPSGLYAQKVGGQVLLGDCPTTSGLYRWTVIDEGGDILKFRNTNGGGILTVFGRTNSGAEYYTGGDGPVSPHRHQMIPTGTDTWRMRNQFQGFYTGVTAPAVGGALIHEELADPTTADEWRFVPIVTCTPDPNATCVDPPNNDELNLVCGCCGSFTLPVELSSFTGETLPKFNQLNWTTVSEMDNAGFFLQRSLDGQSFTDLAWIEGVGNSDYLEQYQYTDETPFNGTSYYRLQQVDFDGTATLSEVVALTRNDGASWTLFPNPVVSGQELRITVRETTTNFQLLDLSGRLVQSFRQDASEGQVTLRLASLPAGIYLLRNPADGSAKKVMVTASR